LKRIRFQFGTLQLTRPRAFVSVQLARNATIGSIREALRAGTYPATAGLVLALVLQRLRCANGLMKRACRQPEDEHAPRATLPKGVRTTPIPGASSILNTRTLWIRDSSFPSQLAFRFEYEPLPSSTAYCLDRAQRSRRPARLVCPSVISFLKPVAISVCCFLLLVGLAFGRATRRNLVGSGGLRYSSAAGCGGGYSLIQRCSLAGWSIVPT
jgi:hypothetical protein